MNKKKRGQGEIHKPRLGSVSTSSALLIHLMARSLFNQCWVWSGCWLTYPSEKYDFVSWDDDIPNWMEKLKSCSKPPTSDLTESNSSHVKHHHLVNQSVTSSNVGYMKADPMCSNGLGRFFHVAMVKTAIAPWCNGVQKMQISWGYGRYGN